MRNMETARPPCPRLLSIYLIGPISKIGVSTSQQQPFSSFEVNAEPYCQVSSHFLELTSDY